MTEPIVFSPSFDPAGSIVVRPAREADTPVLHRIEIDSFQSELWSPDDFLKFDCLVAAYHPKSEETTPPEVVGFLVSHQIYSSARAEPGEREILNLAVDLKFRRLGIATRLLSAELARGGIHFLEVRESNEAARRLYEGHGFEIVGRRNGYYENPSEPAILMRHSHCPSAT